MRLACRKNLLTCRSLLLVNERLKKLLLPVGLRLFTFITLLKGTNVSIFSCGQLSFDSEGTHLKEFLYKSLDFFNNKSNL